MSIGASTLLKFIRTKYYQNGHPIGNNTVLLEADRISQEKFNNNYPQKSFHTKSAKAKERMIERFMTQATKKLLILPRRQEGNNLWKKIKPCESNSIEDGEECLNLCRRKNNCPYKRMVNKQFKKVFTKEKHGKGTCLILDEDCARGDFVIEYFGRKVQERTLKKNGGNGEYYMQVGGITINGDITTKNDAKFINHSCKPNCVARVREINGRDRVFIFTAKKINKSTELTIDYQWTVEREEDQKRCNCSAGKFCRKYMEQLDIK